MSGSRKQANLAGGCPLDGGVGPRLLWLTAVGDGPHLAAANPDDRRELAWAALVQPLFGVDAGNVKAREWLGYGVARAPVVDRSAVVVTQRGRLAAQLPSRRRIEVATCSWDLPRACRPRIRCWKMAATRRGKHSWRRGTRIKRRSRGPTFDMSGGAKGAKRPLGRPLDGGVRHQRNSVPSQTQSGPISLKPRALIASNSSPDS